MSSRTSSASTLTTVPSTIWPSSIVGDDLARRVLAGCIVELASDAGFRSALGDRSGRWRGRRRCRSGSRRSGCCHGGRFSDRGGYRRRSWLGGHGCCSRDWRFGDRRWCWLGDNGFGDGGEIGHGFARSYRNRGITAPLWGRRGTEGFSRCALRPRRMTSSISPTAGSSTAPLHPPW